MSAGSKASVEYQGVPEDIYVVGSIGMIHRGAKLRSESAGTVSRRGV